jgi:hypothetical protein
MSDNRIPGEARIFCAMCVHESRGIDEAMNHVRLLHPDLWTPDMEDMRNVEVVDRTGNLVPYEER